MARSLKLMNIEVDDCQSCSACLSTLLLFLDKYADYINYAKLPDKKLKIRIGKDEKKPEGEDIFMGNCTYRYRDNGIYVIIHPC